MQAKKPNTLSISVSGPTKDTAALLTLLRQSAAIAITNVKTIHPRSKSKPPTLKINAAIAANYIFQQKGQQEYQILVHPKTENTPALIAMQGPTGQLTFSIEGAFIASESLFNAAEQQAAIETQAAIDAENSDDHKCPICGGNLYIDTEYMQKHPDAPTPYFCEQCDQIGSLQQLHLIADGYISLPCPTCHSINVSKSLHYSCSCGQNYSLTVCNNCQTEIPTTKNDNGICPTCHKPHSEN